MAYRTGGGLPFISTHACDPVSGRSSSLTCVRQVTRLNRSRAAHRTPCLLFLRTVLTLWTRCRECRGTNRHGGRCNDGPPEAKGGAHYFNLVKLAINDRTHVVPASFEYHSSYWCESDLMSDHTAFTKIVLSLTVLS